MCNFAMKWQIQYPLIMINHENCHGSVKIAQRGVEYQFKPTLSTREYDD